MSEAEFDVAIVGGGVTGCALARALAHKRPHSKIALLEKEPKVAVHTSGRNSGVVHGGYNQKPGTLKARFCVEGNHRLKEYAAARGVPLAQTGILVVARSQAERSVLEELLRRGRENGVPGLRLVDGAELKRLEPNASGISALHAPSGASVDSAALVESFAEDAKAAGVTFYLGEGVRRIEEDGRGFRIRTARAALRARRLVNCAGLHADRIAHQLGAGLPYSIVPFRGEFYYIDPAKAGLIRSMIYSVPDIRYPFLGVHWTRTVHGKVKVGPNAVLALGREAYGTFQVHAGDTARMLLDGRFWRMVGGAEFRRLAAENLRSSLSKAAFLKQAFSLVQGAAASDFRKGPSGIRAQLVDRDGGLVDDLLVEKKGESLHVLNAISPGLTCALPFADHLARQLD
ncbi:MAG: L-2-hydroxyglutarate oxidase [Elusimicrobia bacterium]|nr:L-2-hydroxyglutarate oxidase [Elusimicrobiota bacterium]